MSVLIHRGRRGGHHRSAQQRRGHLRAVRPVRDDSGVHDPVVPVANAPLHPVRPLRRIPRGEVRRPPTRGRVAPRRARVRPVICAPRREPRRWAWLLALGTSVCAMVVGLGVLTQGMAGSAEVPEQTALVSVGPGETLWEVATRYAPESEPAAVVRRIEELNGLTGADVQPGMALAVPAEPGVAAHPG